MSQHLIDKLREYRRLTVASGRVVFTVRRPTDLEMIDLRSRVIKQGDILGDFVEDWSGITELDIIPGGDGSIVDFSKSLFMEWVADHPEHWEPLTGAILSAYSEHQKKQADLLKKPNAG